jgi:hypothetical protein
LAGENARRLAAAATVAPVRCDVTGYGRLDIRLSVRFQTPVALQAVAERRATLPQGQGLCLLKFDYRTVHVVSSSQALDPIGP